MYTNSLFSHTFGQNANGQTTITRVDKYEFTGDVTNKREQAIIATVKMLGFMSLKNDDHAVSAQNAAANKRVLKEAVETRAAADTLLASGAIVLMGAWSNGIQVGPGKGFAAVAVQPVAVAAPAKPVRKPAASKMERARIASEKVWSQAHAFCEMRYDAGASCEWQPVVSAVMQGPAYVAPLGTPPGLVIADGSNSAESLHAWRAEMDFSYVAPVVRKPMWLPTTDGSLVLNPEFETLMIAHNAAHANAANPEADDADAEIDAMIDAMISKEVAA